MVDKEWPLVTVLICTFEREKELTATLNSMGENLWYPEDRLDFIVCDDGSRTVNWDRVRNDAATPFKLVQTESPRSGWGANVNNGLAHVTSPYIYFTEDDYLMTQHLDLRVGVALMEINRSIGYIRYRGTQGDRNVVLHQQEAEIDAWLPDYHHGPFGLCGKLPYLLFDNWAQSLWLYTNGPHLKHRRFHQYYGPYREGLKLGATEEAFAHVVKDKMRDHPNDAPALAILPDWITMHFDHIGRSYQHTEADNGV